MRKLSLTLIITLVLTAIYADVFAAKAITGLNNIIETKSDNKINKLEVEFSLFPMYEKSYAKDPVTGKDLVIIQYTETSFPKRNYWIHPTGNGPIEKISIVHFTDNIARTVFRVKKGWDIDIQQFEKKLILTAVKKNKTKLANLKAKNLELMAKIASPSIEIADDKTPAPLELTKFSDKEVKTDEDTHTSNITKNEYIHSSITNEDDSIFPPNLDLWGRIESRYYSAFNNKLTDHDSYFNTKLSVGGKYEPKTLELDKIIFTLEGYARYDELGPNNRMEYVDIALSDASVYARKGNWQIEAGLFSAQLGEIPKIRTMADSLCTRDYRFLGLTDEEAILPSPMATITYSPNEDWSLMAFFKPWGDHDEMNIFGGQTAIYGNLKPEITNTNLPPMVKQYVQNISVEKSEETGDLGFVFSFDPTDWLNLNIAYQHGSNDQPNINRFPIQGLQVNDKGEFDFAQLGAITFDPTGKVLVDYPEFNQISIFGTMEIGEELLRYEVAHRDEMPYLAKNLQSVLRSTTQAVVGLEKDLDIGLISTYLLYTHINGNDNNLLFSRNHSPQIAVGWENDFFDNKIKAEIGFISALDKNEYGARGEITWKIDSYLHDSYFKDSKLSIYYESNDGNKDTLLGSRSENRIGLSFKKTF